MQTFLKLYIMYIPRGWIVAWVLVHFCSGTPLISSIVSYPCSTNTCSPLSPFGPLSPSGPCGRFPPGSPFCPSIPGCPFS